MSIDSVLTSADRSTLIKLARLTAAQLPPGVLTSEELDRLELGDGLAERIRASWRVQDETLRVAKALTTQDELITYVPRMISIADRLLALEEAREAREQERLRSEAEAAARAALLRSERLWGREGLIAVVASVLGALGTALAGYLAAGQ